MNLMVVKFKFRKEKSSLLGTIYRPVAKISFFSEKSDYWTDVWAIVDTGADYTIVPRYLASDLAVDLERECKVHTTLGIGGNQKVYFLPKIKARVGRWERMIPLGFLDSDEVPPLMGRHLFLETFETHLAKNHTLSFSE